MSLSNHKLLREKRFRWTSKRTIDMQLIEYQERDYCNFEGTFVPHTYEILMFGITEKSESVCVKVIGFRPYFFIEVPSWFTNAHSDELHEFLQDESYENRYGVSKKLKYPLTHLNLYQLGWEVLHSFLYIIYKMR